MFTRFAVYFCPEPGTALEEFGRNWLGWDLDTGTVAPHPEIAGFDISKITERPRKYGFHGTVKAPFRLAEGETIERLQDATGQLSARIQSFAIPKLHVSRIGKFLAITEAEPCQALRDMAGQFVEHLEPYRAPLTKADLERRRKSNLTPNQDAHLVKWGYPYVFDEFQFHLTLTGPLEEATQSRVKQEAERQLGDALDAPLRVNSISICAEREDGSFMRLSRHVFAD